MIWEGRAKQAVLLSMDQTMDLMVLLHRIGVWAVPAEAMQALPSVALPCQEKMVVWVAMAAEAALIRAVPLVTEAVAARLTATVLKADPTAGEVARIKAKAVTDKTTRFL
jgi:hypothetical protein